MNTRKRTSMLDTVRIPAKKPKSTERVRKFRLAQRNKENYDHEKVKKETRERVAAIQSRQPKCPLGKKCKDQTCNLHPDRGRIRQNQQPRVSGHQRRAMRERKQSRRSSEKELECLMVKVSSLVNENRRLKRSISKVQTPVQTASSPDIAESILNIMSPNGKKRTLKNISTTSGYSPVRKHLRTKCNIQIRNARLFQDDDLEVEQFGDKVIQFLLENDNSFECPDKKRMEPGSEETLSKCSIINSWQRP